MSKYQLIERERKFLLAKEWVNISGLPLKKITDHYLEGTMLRFRTVAEGSAEKYKLTKKVPLDALGESAITTIYLDKQEFALLHVFNTVTVSKARYLLEMDQTVIGIDHYEIPGDDLWLAEIEFPTTTTMLNFKFPLPYVREVTGLPEYDGYQLARRFGK